MSIEKMVMLNMVGHIKDLEAIGKNIVLSGCLHPVSAVQEIDRTNFTLKTSEDNLEALIDEGFIRPYTNERDYSDINSKVKRLKEMIVSSKSTKLRGSINYIWDYEEIETSIGEIEDRISGIYNELEGTKREEKEIEKIIEHLKFIKDVNISLLDMEKLKNLSFGLMKVHKENIERLKHNYENIPSILLKVHGDVEYEILMYFTPNLLKMKADRIFKSLNCEFISLPEDYKGTPKEITKLLTSKLEEIKRLRKDMEKKLKKLSEEAEDKLFILEKSLELEKKSAELKNNIACTNEFFYLSGWIPESMVNTLYEVLESFESRLIIIQKNPEEIDKSITPPTKLKNNNILRPFESMVMMYGIPSYGELDPTAFLGISYMLMFGAMFGDVGQGLIFLLAGLLLGRKEGMSSFGGLISRLGISSIFFGFMYGSIFGFEEIIPALFIRPMEDIMDVLIYAVIFGCGLLIIGFIYSLINSIKRRDLENGAFGKDGVAGLLFYLSIIFFAVSKYEKIDTLPMTAWIFIFILLLSIMLFKEPLANLVLKKRPLYSESKKDYFVEGGFGVIETLLSMFSNTLSFIRVGAFALNHVGLFLAFSALAKMMSYTFESAIMYIIGNLVIIGLEGLIVFIQGLRLEYYELFSKYYDGAGVAFTPVKMDTAGNYLSKKLTSSNLLLNKNIGFIKEEKI